MSAAAFRRRGRPLVLRSPSTVPEGPLRGVGVSAGLRGPSVPTFPSPLPVDTGEPFLAERTRAGFSLVDLLATEVLRPRPL